MVATDLPQSPMARQANNMTSSPLDFVEKQRRPSTTGTGTRPKFNKSYTGSSIMSEKSPTDQFIENFNKANMARRGSLPTLSRPNTAAGTGKSLVRRNTTQCTPGEILAERYLAKVTSPGFHADADAVDKLSHMRKSSAVIFTRPLNRDKLMTGKMSWVPCNETRHTSGPADYDLRGMTHKGSFNSRQGVAKWSEAGRFPGDRSKSAPRARPQKPKKERSWEKELPNLHHNLTGSRKHPLIRMASAHRFSTAPRFDYHHQW